MEISEIPQYIVKEAEKQGVNTIVHAALVRRNQIRFANNVITITNSWDEAIIDVYAEKDKKIAMFKLMDPRSDVLEKAVKELSQVVEKLKPNEDFYGVAHGPFKYNTIPEIFDKKVVDLGEGLVDLAQASINKALENGAKRVAGIVYATHTKQYSYGINGLNAEQEGTWLEITVRGFMEGYASGMGVSVSRVLSKFDPEGAGAKAGKIAKDCEKQERGEPGKYDVIFSPAVFGNLINTVAMSANGFFYDSGLSFFMDKIGEKVASEKLTLIDSGILRNGYESSLYDSEGHPTQETVIIENGILKGLLHNTSTAKKFDTESTGNAGEGVPRSWNTIVKPGQKTLEELIQQVKKGIYVTSNWYTRFQNYQTGDFSTIPRDGIFLIKDGEIVGAIKEIRISENMIHVLQQIEELGKNPEQIKWWEVDSAVLTPPVLIRDLNITRSKK